MSKQKPKKATNEQLRILSKPPAVGADGNSLTLTSDNFGDLLFFQISQKGENFIDARGVANVRMTLKQLKALKGLLEMAITDHEKKMASKGQKTEDVA